MSPAKRSIVAATMSGAGVVEGFAASRAWKKTSGFCAVPRRTGWSGVSAPPRCAPRRSSSISAAESSSESVLDLRDLVRGPEAVEEVQERDARVESGRVRDRGEVLRLLDGAGGEHREAGLPAGHHVRVVAEDRERVRRERARRDVHAEGRQLARDLVHVGDHQEQALRRREGRRERAGLQRAVHRAGGAALRLHLDDVRERLPQTFVRPSADHSSASSPIGEEGVIG